MISTPMFTQAYRPFFPLAALLSAVAVLYWLAGLSGMVPLPPQPTLWHAHEMLFGFAAALIAGFVLTAVVNWTKRPAVTPGILLCLTGIWLAARVAAFLPLDGAMLFSAVMDSMFLPAVAALMTTVLLKAGNRRNYMFIPFLWGLAAINIAFHFMMQQQAFETARMLISFTAYLLGFLMVFMGGRVIPFFSANRCQYQPIQRPWLNWLSTLSTLGASVLIITQPMSTQTVAFSTLAGCTTLLRLLLWQPWRIWRVPLLSILYIGYAWLGIALLLAAAVHAGWLNSPTLPIHALMAGALGCLGLGMMTRVALGHSGQALVATPAMRAAFVLVIVAGLFRIGSYLPWVWGGLYGLTLSAIFWALAFLLYFLVFAPLLWSPLAAASQQNA